MNVTESWSLGWVVGGPIAIVLLLLLFAAAALFFFAGARERKGEYTDRRFFFGLGWTITVIGALLLVFFLTPWGFYPTGGSDYHKWKPKQGEVAEVASRLLPAGEGSVEQKIVIRFEGDPQEYGVTDTRAALLKAGDQAILKCKRSYQWGSVHGFDCRFIQRIPAAK